MAGFVAPSRTNTLPATVTVKVNKSPVLPVLFVAIVIKQEAVIALSVLFAI